MSLFLLFLKFHVVVNDHYFACLAIVTVYLLQKQYIASVNWRVSLGLVQTWWWQTSQTVWSLWFFSLESPQTPRSCKCKDFHSWYITSITTVLPHSAIHNNWGHFGKWKKVEILTRLGTGPLSKIKSSYHLSSCVTWSVSEYFVPHSPTETSPLCQLQG